jgi:xylulose-5-phosphate/fructose-6-phosphate phosphoketolase
MQTETLAPTLSATLSRELLHKMNAYWRAANYLSVGQIYLYDNPLLKEPLARQASGGRALGHDAGSELHLRASEPGHQEV